MGGEKMSNIPGRQRLTITVSRARKDKKGKWEMCWIDEMEIETREMPMKMSKLLPDISDMVDVNEYKFRIIRKPASYLK